MKKTLLTLSFILFIAPLHAQKGPMNWAKRMEAENNLFWKAFSEDAVKSIDDVIKQIAKDADKHKWSVKHIFSIKLDRERHDNKGPLQYAVAFFTEEGHVVRIRYLAETLTMLKYNVQLRKQ